MAHGTGENLGNPLKESNLTLRNELKQVFCAFYDKHVDESDENTCILKITLSDAVIFHNKYKYKIDFTVENAVRSDYNPDLVI